MDTSSLHNSSDRFCDSALFADHFTQLRRQLHTKRALGELLAENQDLLRISIASAGNDHRMGAHEAPPAIISIFLGDELTAVVNSIINGTNYVDPQKSVMRIGVDVLPEYRRQGIAAKLLQVFLDFAKANKLAFLTLEVRASNYDAIALYGSRGFRSVGRRKNYYEHPKEDAIIMTLEFDHGTENPNN